VEAVNEVEKNAALQLTLRELFLNDLLKPFSENKTKKERYLTNLSRVTLSN